MVTNWDTARRAASGRASATRLQERASGIRPELLEKVSTIVEQLDVAQAVQDMDLPGFRFHPLRGDRRGYWPVAVRANWRIVFRFERGHAYDVELIDYH